jgi:DNA replication and repair protein RecF
MSPAASPHFLRAPRVRRVTLADFRSYPAHDLRLSSAVVALAGDNGAGKTNLLEALSLFTPGRGLRRAELSDLAREGGSGGFAVSVELSGEEGGLVQMGTGAELSEGALQKRFRIDREPISSSRAFADHVRIVWLTPAMDGLFTGPAGERRRFLDRLVLAVDSEHGARVNALERALRNRNRLLEERRGEKIWLDAAEREIAELAIAVAAARRETTERPRSRWKAKSTGWSPNARRWRPRIAFALCCATTARAIPPPDAPLLDRRPATSSCATAPSNARAAAPQPASRRRCWSGWSSPMRGLSRR